MKVYLPHSYPSPDSGFPAKEMGSKAALLVWTDSSNMDDWGLKDCFHNNDETQPPNSLDPLNQADDPDVDRRTNTGVLRKCPKLCLGSAAPAEIHQEWEKCPRGKEHGLRGTKVGLLTKNGSQEDIRLKLCACPSPSAECLGASVLNLCIVKVYLIYLNPGESVEAGHSLGPVLDFSYHGNCQTAVISTQPKGMASNEACPVLGPGVTENPGDSMPVFTALPFTIPAPGPAHGPPLVTALVPPGGPLVPSAFPRTPLVAGQDGRGPNWVGASSVLVQMRTEMGPVKAPQTQTLVLTQAPHVWQAPGTLCGDVTCQPPRPLAAAPVVPTMAAQVAGGTQACEGGWSQGLPPPAPPPAPQPAPIMAPGNAGPWPQGAHGEGSLAPSQAKAPLDDTCKPKSVYENFRLWQHYKPLARRHLPQSPDTEALSCFFLSLAWRKPSLTLEEGLSWALREWQLTSNFDRMIYYEIAGEFLEFEAEEEMQIQKSQWMKGPQCLPPPAPPGLEPQGHLAPEVVKQPVYLPSKAGPEAPPACLPPPRPQQPAETKANLPPARWPAETKAPEETPPEAVQEYTGIMDELLGPPAGAMGELEGPREEGEVEQEADGMLSDPDLLSYIDKLCSQKDFVTKVEAVIHPRHSFLEELLSPDPQMDFLALSQELEQEEGLTLAQVAEKRCLFSEGRCARAAPSHDTARLDSISSKSAVGQGAEREVPDSQQGVSMESCPPQMAARDPQGRGKAHIGISGSRNPVVLLERLDSHKLRASRPNPPPQDHRSIPQRAPRDPEGRSRACSGMAKTKNPIVVLERLDFHGVRAAQPDSPPQDHRPTCPGMGTKDTWGLPGASPELSQSPIPASGLLSPEGRGPQGALRSQPLKKRGLSPAPAPATKSKKRALLRGPSPAQQTPHLGPGLRVSGAQSLAWGLGGPSQSRKRKGDPLPSKRKKRQHCSQWGARAGSLVPSPTIGPLDSWTLTAPGAPKQTSPPLLILLGISFGVWGGT
ncbi:NUT family member 2B, partial [Plecturocebus cupreus]